MGNPLPITVNIFNKKKPTRISDEAITGPTKAESFVRENMTPYLEDSMQEVFLVLGMDAGNKPTLFEALGLGTVDRAAVYPREVVRRLLECGCTSVIVAHNHPSGRLEASQADIDLTRHLKMACDLFEISLLDHFLITDKGMIKIDWEGGER